MENDLDEYKPGSLHLISDRIVLLVGWFWLERYYNTANINPSSYVETGLGNQTSCFGMRLEVQLIKVTDVFLNFYNMGVFSVSTSYLMRLLLRTNGGHVK